MKEIKVTVGSLQNVHHLTVHSSLPAEEKASNMHFAESVIMALDEAATSQKQKW